MHQARSAIDGAIYTAIEFAELPAARMDALRSHFLCIACDGPAHFRKASSSGKGPCFVGRPHAEGCELFTGGEDPWGELGDDVVQRLEADRSRIILALGAAGDEPQVAGGGERPAGGGRRYGAVGGAPLGTRIQRGPRRMLEWLVHSQTFGSSQIPIVLPNGDEVPAATFFVPFTRASGAVHAGFFRAYWGRPASVRVWQRGGLTYLNTVAGRNLDSLSVYLPDDLHIPICEKFRIERVEQLTEMFVLFCGTARVSTGGKFTFDLASVGTMAAIRV